MVPQLGWGQVRQIVSAARGLSQTERQLVDARVAEVAKAHGHGVQSFDPDGLVWAVDAAVAELTPGAAEQAERRRVNGNVLSRQMDFDGGMRGFFSLDALWAAVVNTIDAAMGRPPAGAGQPADPHDPDADGDGEGEAVELERPVAASGGGARGRCWSRTSTCHKCRRRRRGRSS